MNVQNFLIALADNVTYLANGGLTLFYLVADHAAQWIAVGAAVTLMLTFDALAQREAVFAPGRYASGAPAGNAPPRTAQIMTGLALALWLAASWTFGPPIPAIGAAMWVGGLLILLCMPQQRWSLLWTIKGYLILYSLAVLGFRALLWQAGGLSPSEWAEVFGGERSAAQIIAQNTGTLATMGAWLLWAILPVGYFALFLQNLFAQPLALVHPLQNARDVLAALRTRTHPAALERQS